MFESLIQNWFIQIYTIEKSNNECALTINNLIFSTFFGVYLRPKKVHTICSFKIIVGQWKAMFNFKNLKKNSNIVDYRKYTFMVFFLFFKLKGRLGPISRL